MHRCLDIGQKGPEMTGISTNLRSCKVAANFSWYHLLLRDCVYKNFARDYRHNEGSRHSKIRCPAVLNNRCSFSGILYASRSPGHRNTFISKVTNAMVQMTNTSMTVPQKVKKKKVCTQIKWTTSLNQQHQQHGTSGLPSVAPVPRTSKSPQQHSQLD